MTMTTTLTGKMLIGAAAVAGTDGGQCAFNPATNADIAEPRFGFGTAADVDRAATLAAAAFDEYRALPLARRAAFLEAIADNIMALGERRRGDGTGLPEDLPGRIDQRVGLGHAPFARSAASVRTSWPL